MSKFSAALILILSLTPFSAHATIVTTAIDEDNGSLSGGAGVSLREAVKYSTAGDIITFHAALSGQTIRLILGEITISKSLTIDGSALPVKITLSGDKTGNGKTSDDTRILNITTGTVLLNSLILTRGYSASGSRAYGGAIYINSTSTRLVIRNSTISDNEAGTFGGAIYFSGAIDSPDSTLTIQNCTLSGSYTGHNGGGIHMYGTLRVENTSFSDNSANQGCAIYNQGGSTTVVNCNLKHNIALGGGYGGGIYNYGNLIIRRSTFSGNSAGQGGAIYNTTGPLNIENSTFTANSDNAIRADSGSVTVLHTTISGNSGSIGGGIYQTSGSLSINQSIVAGNKGSHPLNIAGKSYSGSNNLTSGDPFLAPLDNYGGPTPTLPPLYDSPAVDKASTSTLTTDQRGFPRDTTPDLGATEFRKSTSLANFWKLDSDGDGSPYGTEQALGTDPSAADSADFRNLSTPVFDGAGRAVVKFGIHAGAATGTRWILKRSPDLSLGGFSEIYRFDGSKDSAAPGITYVRTANDVTVTDAVPYAAGAFYRFEAILDH